MKLLLASTLLCFSICISAQKIDNFSAVNAVDNKAVSLKDYASAKAVVVMFMGNACAFDGYYTNRIKSLVARTSNDVQWIFVNSYLEQEESADQMRARIESWGLTVPYLADKEQLVMNALGARKSPEVFLLKPAAGAFTVVYSGAIDDNPQLEEAVKVRYLGDAIDAVLEGKNPAVPNVRASGCTIRKK